ncbi:hypothetical protein K2X33_03790 [bacterium]|nr:hypothetical protein [bacterium]
MIFTPEETKRIEARIAEVERGTSGEIVVCAVPASGSYAWTYWVWAALGLALGTIGAGTWEFTQWNVSIWGVLEWQGGGLLAGVLVSLFGPARRVLVSQSHRARKVHRSALASFLTQGMTETDQRTGVLVYLSEWEHRVEVVADQGIHSKVESGFWDEQVRLITQGIREGKAAEALEKAIAQMGTQLTRLFPAKDQKNELPNTIRTDLD